MGKDADFVVWDGNPLSNYSHTNQTWIDGRRYFDRAEDVEARKNFAAQRDALVQKALTERVKDIGKPKEAEEKKPADKDAKPPPGDWHREHELVGAYGDGSDRYECTEADE